MVHQILIPQRASAAFIIWAVAMSSMALPLPISLGKSLSAAVARNYAQTTLQASPIRALSEATRIWQLMASSSPPPKGKAIHGCDYWAWSGSRLGQIALCWPSCSKLPCLRATAKRLANSEMSAPSNKGLIARPGENDTADVITSSASLRQAIAKFMRSLAMFKALSLSGRLIVTVAI